MAKRTKRMQLLEDAQGRWKIEAESEFPGVTLKLTRTPTGRIGWEIRVSAFDEGEAIRIVTDADARLREWVEVQDRLLQGLPGRDGEESPFLQRT
jgi:hypothetical protein